MPQISDTMTSGTTKSFKEAIKTRPTTSKTPRMSTSSIKMRRSEAGSSTPTHHSMSEPNAMPATIASRMRLVSDILFLAGLRMPGNHSHIGARVTGRGINTQRPSCIATTHRVIDHGAHFGTLTLAGLPAIGGMIHCRLLLRCRTTASTQKHNDGQQSKQRSVKISHDVIVRHHGGQ